MCENRERENPSAKVWFLVFLPLALEDNAESALYTRMEKDNTEYIEDGNGNRGINNGRCSLNTQAALHSCRVVYENYVTPISKELPLLRVHYRRVMRSRSRRSG